MYKTIEEKLSAIKAINEEKTTVDTTREHIIKITESLTGVEGISFLQHSANVIMKLPAQVYKDVAQTIDKYLITRHDELIAKAEQIMRPEKRMAGRKAKRIKKS